MRRAVKAGVLFGSLAALAACSAIIGTRDITLVDADAGEGTDAGGTVGDGGAPDTTQNPPNGSDTGAPDTSIADTSILDTSAPDTTPIEAACSTNLNTDVHNCGRCSHDCLGGDCKLGVCQPILLIPGQPGSVSVAVDSTSVYWVSNYNNQVLKADKNGQNLTILAHDGSGNAAAPYGIALDSTYVYWASDISPGGVVARCAKSGACNGVGQALTPANLDAPRAVAIDGTTIYWAESDVVGSIGRQKLDGGSFGYLLTNERNLWNFTLDDASVFFGSQVNVGRIAKSAPVVDSGSVDAAAPYTVIASGALYANGLAVDDTNLYWAEQNDPGAVRWAAKNSDGGVIHAIADSEHNPWYVAIDASNIYWTARGPDSSTDPTITLYVDSYVATCPKTGCGSHPPTILASSIHNVAGIALDDTAVYVAYYGNQTAQGTVSEGGIIKIAKP